jgi:hypothetical protein
MNPEFTRHQTLPALDVEMVLAHLTETGDRAESQPNAARRSQFPRNAAVPAASSGGVSPREGTRGGTPRELAGEDARATFIRA